jgi:hypothetical protein
VIAGHFGLAAGVKARETAVPLWALMLATQWLDVVFVPLFLAHVERIDVIGGGQPGYGNGIIHADYTHSLVGAIVLSLVFALPAAWRWGRRAAAVLGAVVFSHWILDLLVHRHDMPLLPGAPAGTPLFGFGLWRWPLVAAIAARSHAAPARPHRRGRGAGLRAAHPRIERCRALSADARAPAPFQSPPKAGPSSRRSCRPAARPRGRPARGPVRRAAA